METLSSPPDAMVARVIVRETSTSAPRGPAWLRAQRSLAAALVTGATRPDDIASIQRAVLIPLELWLIQRSRSEAITSRRVIELAAEGLSDHPPAG
jgi:hypothetical protein